MKISKIKVKKLMAVNFFVFYPHSLLEICEDEIFINGSIVTMYVIDASAT